MNVSKVDAPPKHGGSVCLTTGLVPVLDERDDGVRTLHLGRGELMIGTRSSDERLIATLGSRSGRSSSRRSGLAGLATLG
jgi:hypothetical protein